MTINSQGAECKDFIHKRRVKSEGRVTLKEVRIAAQGYQALLPEQAKGRFLWSNDKILQLGLSYNPMD